jgi:titin
MWSRTRLTCGAGRPYRRLPVVCAVVAASVLSWGSAALAAPALAGQQVNSVTVLASSLAAGATSIQYSVAFFTSGSGGLSALTGKISLSGPTGMFTPGGAAMTSDNFFVTDITANGYPTAPGGVSVSADGSQATLTLASGQSVAAGDRVDVSIYGVTNAGAGSQSVSVSTSSDSTPVNAPFTLSAALSVVSPTVALSSEAAGATAVEYAATFKASKTGGVVYDPSDPSLGGAIMLGGPAGMFRPGGTAMGPANFVIDDHTSGGVSNPSSVSVSANGSKATLTLADGYPILGNDSVEVQVYGVTSPSAPGSATLSVSTTSDTAAGAGFSTVAANAAGSPSVSLSSGAAGATGVQYQVGFTASATGNVVYDASNGPLSGTITLAAAAGTQFSSSSANYSVNDVTSGSQAAPSEVTVSSGGAAATLVTPFAISAGDSVQVEADSVSNAPSTCAQNLAVSTSSDTAADAGYSLTGVPQSPGGLSATPGANQVALAWNAPCNGGSSITSYVVDEYLGSTATGTPTVIYTPTAATSEPVTGLTAGKEYTFTVEATNATGTGPASGATSTTPGGVPGAPGKLTAAPLNKSVSLAWLPPTGYKASGVTSYKVEEYVGASATGTPAATFSVPAPKRGYVVAGLTNGQEYSFTIAAVNAAGAGPASNAVQATPEPTAPSAPKSLAAVGSSGQVSLTWKPPEHLGGSPTTAYDLYRSTTLGSFGTTPIASVGGTTLAYTDSSVTNGTTYYYAVEAVNAIGHSPNSNVASATP